jgi:PilX N-terminal
MTAHTSRLSRVPDQPQHQRGTALIIASVLLLIVTLLGVTGLVAASLELQMAGNFQHQERAFQAAEFAIEEALHSTPLSTTLTLTNPQLFPAPGVDALVPGSTTDTYDYRLYYDSSAGGTPLPRGSDGDTTLFAYHFVIVGTGHSSRGAQSTHVQGFYVLGTAACAVAGTACNFDTAERTKTYWIQQSAE